MISESEHAFENVAAIDVGRAVDAIQSIVVSSVDRAKGFDGVSYGRSMTAEPLTEAFD